MPLVSGTHQQRRVPLQLTCQSDVASNHPYPELISGTVVAELCPRICSQLVRILAVRRLEILRDECTAVGFNQLLHMVSFQAL